MSIQTFNIRFERIDIVEKAMFNSTIAPNAVFNFEVKTQAYVDEQQQIIVVFVAVDIWNDNKIALGKITVGCTCKIEDLNTVFERGEDGKMIIPPDLDDMLKSISISTTRGVMYSEFRGTPLHGAVLPIIVPATLQPAEGNIVDVGLKQNV